MPQAHAVSCPSLSLSSNFSSDGVVNLSWVSDDFSESEQTEYLIQMSRGADFSKYAVYYQGPQMKSVLTGLEDGEYFFRAHCGSQSGEGEFWSDPVQLTVKHHELHYALTFFVLGLLIFIALIVVIARGATETPKGVAG